MWGCGGEAWVVLEGPGSAAEGAEQWLPLGVSVGGPDSHAVVVQLVPAARLARHQALALHHAHQAYGALRLLLTTKRKGTGYD